MSQQKSYKYTCKYDGCSVTMSRKSLIEKHEKECYHNYQVRARADIEKLNQALAELQTTVVEQSKIIQSLQIDMVKFQARTKKAVRQQQIDDLDEFNPRTFRRLMGSEGSDQFFEEVFKKAGRTDRYVETFCEKYLTTCKPFFLVLSQNKLLIKGHIGHVRGTGDVGKPGGCEDIPSGEFYDAFISQVIDILEDRVDRIYYNNDVTRLKLQSDLYTYPRQGDKAAAKIYGDRKRGLRRRLIDFMKKNQWKETPPSVLEL